MGNKIILDWRFTIVELLIVITIIIILLSLFLPALRNAKMLAKDTKCISNLRQVGIALLDYANSYNGWTPKAYENPGRSWEQVLYDEGFIVIPVKGNQSILVCPSFTTGDNYTGVWNKSGRCYGMRYESNYRAFFIINSPVKCSNGYSWGSPSNFLLIGDSRGSSNDCQWYLFMYYAAGVPVHLRHNHKSNFLFADAHVKALNRKELIDNYNFVSDAITE